MSSILPVATRSPASRTGFCTRCDSPIYSDETDCHHCGGRSKQRAVPWDALAATAAVLALVVLALQTLVSSSTKMGHSDHGGAAATETAPPVAAHQP
jgi:hypothetical protein